jgi:hypothetical protein
MTVRKGRNAKTFMKINDMVKSLLTDSEGSNRHKDMHLNTKHDNTIIHPSILNEKSGAPLI